MVNYPELHTNEAMVIFISRGNEECERFREWSIYRKNLNYRGPTKVEFHNLALFVDASISSSTDMVRIGAVIFAANKRKQAALSKPLEGNLSVLHVEALVILVGLCWAQDIGLLVIIISSDSLSLVQALNNSNVYHNELGIIISDIKMVLSSFQGVAIRHVKHEFNIAAHKLAKKAVQLESE